MNIFEGSRHSFQKRVPKRDFPIASYQAMLPSSWQFLEWRATILQITGQYMPQSLPSPNLVIKSCPFSGDNAPRWFRSSLATELRGGNGVWPSTGRKKSERWASVWARIVDVDPWTFVIPDLTYSEEPSTSPATGVRHHLCIRLSVKAYVVEKRLRMKEVYVKKISLLSARTFCL